MPWGLKRFYGSGDLHFITSSCYRRQAFLASEQRRDLFLPRSWKRSDNGTVSWWWATWSCWNISIFCSANRRKGIPRSSCRR